MDQRGECHFDSQGGTGGGGRRAEARAGRAVSDATGHGWCAGLKRAEEFVEVGLQLNWEGGLPAGKAGPLCWSWPWGPAGVTTQ